MDIINIKVHPPWYARGTPIVNTRDGPPMAISDKPLFAIRVGPSARGKPGKCLNAYPDSTKLIGTDRPRKRAYRMRECINEDESQKLEDRSRGNSRGKTHLWLMLKTTFFNTQNRAYSRRYALLGRKWDVFFNAVKSLDVDRLEERSAVGC